MDPLRDCGAKEHDTKVKSPGGKSRELNKDTARTPVRNGFQASQPWCNPYLTGWGKTKADYAWRDCKRRRLYLEKVLLAEVILVRARLSSRFLFLGRQVLCCPRDCTAIAALCQSISVVLSEFPAMHSGIHRGRLPFFLLRRDAPASFRLLRGGKEGQWMETSGSTEVEGVARFYPNEHRTGVQSCSR